MGRLLTLDVMSAAEQEEAGVETRMTIGERARQVLQQLSGIKNVGIFIVSNNGFGQRFKVVA